MSQDLYNSTYILFYFSEEIVIEYNKMSSNKDRRDLADRRDSNGSNSEDFPRIPSESSLVHQIADHRPSKPWERSQSALDLKGRYRSQSVDILDSSSTTSSSSHSSKVNGGKVSEHSSVYWDLSKGDEDMMQSGSSRGGKFKISLHTIHQKGEVKSNPRVSVQTRVVRRMASETAMTPNSVNTEVHEFMLPGPESPVEDSTPSPTKTEFQFFFNQGKPNLSVTLSKAVPVLQENIQQLKAESERERCGALRDMLGMIEQAWATPTIGRDLAYGLCDVLRTDGGLDILIDNCDPETSSYKIKLGSAKVLEQSMTVENREFVADKGLGVIVKLAKSSKDDREMTKVTTGILESLFKHSEDTCSNAIDLGGLDSILYSCRTMDTMTLRHCAGALANLAMFGGANNQQEMISHKAAEWLFPLAFCNDDSVRYYAFLAIACLSANKEIESAVVKSGTLELVKPFIASRDPFEFGQSDKAHIHGQSKYWLQRLLPLLESGRDEAQSLAAFHFAMEAGIKAEQGKLEVVCI